MTGRVKGKMGGRNKKQEIVDSKSLDGMRDIMMRWRKDSRTDEERNARNKVLSSEEGKEERKEVNKMEKKSVLDGWRRLEAEVQEDSYETWKKKKICPVKRKASDSDTTTSLQSTTSNTRNISNYKSENEAKRTKFKNNIDSSSSSDVLGGKVDHGDGGVRLVGGDGEGGQAVGVQRARATVLSANTNNRERFGDLSGWVKTVCAGKAIEGKFVQ